MNGKSAVIGVGHWGKVLLSELKKVSDVKYECDSKTNLDKVLSDPEITTVFIATPTETHYGIAYKALEAGKHIFLEKPGTTKCSDLEKLVSLAESKKLIFAVGYEFPHHKAAKKLKNLLEGKLIKNIFFDWNKWGSFNDDSIPYLFCHEVSIAKFFGLELKPIRTKKTKVISDTDIVEIEGENFISKINRVSPVKEKRVTILTNNGNYVWENDDLFEVSDAELKKIELNGNTPVATELRDFLDAVEKKLEPQSSGHFAIDVYKIVEMAASL